MVRFHWATLCSSPSCLLAFNDRAARPVLPCCPARSRRTRASARRIKSQRAPYSLPTCVSGGPRRVPSGTGLDAVATRPGIQPSWRPRRKERKKANAKRRGLGKEDAAKGPGPTADVALTIRQSVGRGRSRWGQVRAERQRDHQLAGAPPCRSPCRKPHAAVQPGPSRRGAAGRTARPVKQAHWFELMHRPR